MNSKPRIGNNVKGGMPPSGRPPKRKLNKGSLSRLLKILFKSYPVLLPISIASIAFSAIVAVLPAIFLEKVTTAVDIALKNGLTWEIAKSDIIPKVLILLLLYVLSLIAVAVETQMMAVITQGFLAKMREQMFNGMQNLPIRYFDTHKHGDIMSYYTNDIDTLRQLVSQTIPTIIRAGIIVVSVMCIMLWFSLWLTLVLIFGVTFMFFVSKKFGGGSAKYFVKLQDTVGKQEGFVQEMMNGQKVVKVFCREEK